MAKACQLRLTTEEALRQMRGCGRQGNHDHAPPRAAPRILSRRGRARCRRWANCA
jgi:hypothetical protein